MCGIAGFADRDRGDIFAPARSEAEFGLVHRMCEVIRHRGPDDEGIHVEPGVGLGMRRLSIIDLAGGGRPNHNQARTLWGVFKRGDYKYPQLRRELEALGHRVYTSNGTRSNVPAHEQ